MTERALSPGERSGIVRDGLAVGLEELAAHAPVPVAARLAALSSGQARITWGAVTWIDG